MTRPGTRRFAPFLGVLPFIVPIDEASPSGDLGQEGPHMADQWYLARDGKEFGPYSGAHVLKLAELGRIQPTDLVRKEGMVQGVPAARLKRLFPDASAEPAASAEPFATPLPEAARMPPSPALLVGDSGPTPIVNRSPEATPDPSSGSLTLRPITGDVDLPAEERPAPALAPEPEARPAPGTGGKSQTKASPNATKPKTHQRRAVVISGAIIVSQDGVAVKFRRKCPKCGHEESVRTSMIIAVGQMRSGFFCPKCRRRFEATLQGMG
jgi:hypothetical protein